MSDYPPPPPPGGNQPGGYQTGQPLNHPQSATILVLGILGLGSCGLLAIPAWLMGSKALAEIDTSGLPYTDRGTVRAGQILGMIGTGLLALGAVAALAATAIIVAGA